MDAHRDPVDFRDEYDRKYAAGDLAVSPFFARQFQRLHEMFLPGTQGPKVLDLGGGTGHYSKMLQDLGYEVMLMDISEVAVKKARGLGVQNAECVDFRSCESMLGEFDIILAKGFSLLNTTDMEDFENTLLQMEAMLKEGGIILFWSNTDQSSTWSSGRFYGFRISTIKPYFDRLYLFPALRHQLWMPEWSIALSSSLIDLLPFSLPRAITLIGARIARSR